MISPPHRPVAAWRRSLAFALVVATSSCDTVTPPDPQVADRIVFLAQPTDAIAGQNVTPAIRVQIVDKNGEPVALPSQQEVQLVLVATGPRDTLKGQTTAVFIDGQAVFSNVYLDRTTTGLRVAAVSKKLTGALSQPFNVNPGIAAQLRFVTQPTDVVAGEPIVPAPVIEVQDSKQNRVPTFQGAVTVGIRTGVQAVVMNNTVNCVDGLCTFPQLKITKAAVGFTLAGSTLGGSTLVDATSSVFEVKPGNPSKLIFAQQPFNNLVNAVFDPPIRVEVVDTLDNIVRSSSPTITLAFSNNPNGAALGGTLQVAAENGVVDFTDISVNKAGVNYRLSAATTGLTTALSSFFSIVSSGALRSDVFDAPAGIRFLMSPREAAVGR